MTEYLQSNSSELDSFIRYWDETLAAKPSPAVRWTAYASLSIHKSKGLEFHTVLIPFCDWKLENETNNQLVWCVPPEEPYNAISLVPVNYSTTMAGIHIPAGLSARTSSAVGGQSESAVRGLYPCRQEPHPLEPEGTEGNHVRTPCQHLPHIAKDGAGSWDEEALYMRTARFALPRPRLTA